MTQGLAAIRSASRSRAGAHCDRLPEVDDVADAVEFLLGDKAPPSPAPS
jgi:hypothetical protein